MDASKRFLSFSKSTLIILLRARQRSFSKTPQNAGRFLQRQFRFYQHGNKGSPWKRLGTVAVGLTAGSMISTAMFDKNFIWLPNVACESADKLQVEEIGHEHFDGYKGELQKANKDIHVKLYQYHNCPFCCKVRAFLDYYGIDYEKVEVNPLLKGEIKFSTYRKVPIAIVNEQQQLNDSSLIISILRSYMLGKGSFENLLVYYPKIETGEGRSKKTEYQNRHNVMYMEAMGSKEKTDAIREELKWRKWVDSSLVHMLSPNIYRTFKEAYQAFEYFSEVGNFGSVERFFAINCGAIFMYVLSKSLKKRYKLKDDVRLSLYEDVNSWVKAVGKKRKFMGGNQPNLADLSVYGVLTSIEGLDAFEDMMNHTDIKPWYNRMKKAVTSNQGKTEYRQLIEKL